MVSYIKIDAVTPFENIAIGSMATDSYVLFSCNFMSNKEINISNKKTERGVCYESIKKKCEDGLYLLCYSEF